jgi:hypothetical protein
MSNDPFELVLLRLAVRTWPTVDEPRLVESWKVPVVDPSGMVTVVGTDSTNPTPEIATDSPPEPAAGLTVTEQVVVLPLTTVEGENETPLTKAGESNTLKSDPAESWDTLLSPVGGDVWPL